MKNFVKDLIKQKTPIPEIEAKIVEKGLTVEEAQKIIYEVRESKKAIKRSVLLYLMLSFFYLMYCIYLMVTIGIPKFMMFSSVVLFMELLFFYTKE